MGGLVHQGTNDPPTVQSVFNLLTPACLTGDHGRPLALAYEATFALAELDLLLRTDPGHHSIDCSWKCTRGLTLALLVFYRARQMDRLDWAGSGKPVLLQHVEQLEGDRSGAPKDQDWRRF